MRGPREPSLPSLGDGDASAGDEKEWQALRCSRMVLPEAEIVIEGRPRSRWSFNGPSSQRGVRGPAIKIVRFKVRAAGRAGDRRLTELEFRQ